MSEPAANRLARLGVEQRVSDLDEIAGCGFEGESEAEIGAEHVGGVGERGDFLFLQIAGRDDFKGAVFGELAELGGDAFNQAFAERGELRDRRWRQR